ncbi:MAG: hypothetical protein AAGK79_20735, partial [Pseudomonadota bacterium]
FARWQMSVRNSPAFEGAAVAGVGYFDEDRLMGFMGAMPTPFNLDGVRVSGTWLCNLLAAPETHDKGIGLKLMTSVHSLPFQVIGAVGINLSVIPMYRAMRYVTGDRVPRYIRVLDPDRFAQIVDGDSWRDLAVPTQSTASGLRTESVAEIPQTWNTAWQRFAEQGYAGTDRDADYITWRYLEHPTFDYKVALTQNAQGEAVGLCVWRIEPIRDSDISVCRLIDLIALSPEAVRALSATVEDHARAHDCAMIDHYSTHPIAQNLRSAGWFPEEAAPDCAVPCLFQPLAPGRRDMNYVVRFAKRDGRMPIDPARVHIVKSDGDQDRPN